MSANKRHTLKSRLSLILSLLIAVTTLASTAVSLRIYAGKSIQDAIEMNRDLTFQRFVNAESVMEQLENDLFQAYNASGIPAMLRAGETGVYQDIRLRTELGQILHGMTFADFALVEDLQGNQYVASKSYFHMDRGLLESLESEALGLAGGKGRCTWGIYNGQIVVSRMMYRTDRLRPVGYISVGINPARLSDLLHFDVNGLGDCALVHRDGDTYAATGGLPVMAWERFSAADASSPWVGWEGARYHVERAAREGGPWEVLSILPASHFTGNLQQVVVSSFVVAAVACALALALVYLVVSDLSGKIGQLLRQADDIAGGRFRSYVEPSSYDELDVLTVRFNRLGRQIERLLGELMEETRAKHELEYKILESQYHAILAQLNPHFIYNSLETINSVALLNGAGEVSTLICRFAQLFRLTMRRGNGAVPLWEEMEYIKAYLAFYQLTYPQKIAVDYEVDGTLSGVLLPSPIFQPIVENAIVHGVEKSTAMVRLSIRCFAWKGGLVMEVEDDGPGIEAAALEKINLGLASDRRSEEGEAQDGHMGMGLSSVNRLIKLRYGAGYGISVSSRPHISTQVRMTLPLEHGSAAGEGEEQ